MMAQNVGSKEREQPAYMRYHEDGLLDLLVGLGVLLAGLTMLVDSDLPLPVLWVVLWVPIWMSAKKSITARRLPDVEVPKQHLAGMMRAGVFIVLMLVLALLAGMVVLWGRSTGSVPAGFLEGLREYVMVVLGVTGAFVMGVAALLSGLERLYAYAVLIAVAFVGGYLLNAPIALAITVVASIIMLCGAGMLVRFVRKYPIQPV
jgi:hypothetical protein